MTTEFNREAFEEDMLNVLKNISTLNTWKTCTQILQ